LLLGVMTVTMASREEYHGPTTIVDEKPWKTSGC